MTSPKKFLSEGSGLRNFEIDGKKGGFAKQRSLSVNFEIS